MTHKIEEPKTLDIIYEAGSFEPPHDSEGYLYVVEIKNLGVKFGITRDPKNRLAQHKRDAAAYGREVGRIWLSSPHVGYVNNETTVRRTLHTEREYVSNNFEQVTGIAEQTSRERQTAPDCENETSNLVNIIHMWQKSERDASMLSNFSLKALLILMHFYAQMRLDGYSDEELQEIWRRGVDDYSDADKDTWLKEVRSSDDKSHECEQDTAEYEASALAGSFHCPTQKMRNAITAQESEEAVINMECMCDQSMMYAAALWSVARALLNDGHTVADVHRIINTPDHPGILVERPEFDRDLWARLTYDMGRLEGETPDIGDAAPTNAWDLYWQTDQLINHHEEKCFDDTDKPM